MKNYITKKFKEYTSKETVDGVMNTGVEVATNGIGAIIDGVMIKLLFWAVVISLVVGGSCVGTSMIINGGS